MGMATLQFYKNNYYYPHFSNTITPYGSSLQCTPVGINLRSGTLRVAGDMADFMNCNYLAFTRDGHTLYAWIEDVRFRTEDSFEVDYSVDPFRTYKDKINLGVQYIERRPQATSHRDPLLGAEQPHSDVYSYSILTNRHDTRVLVVQTRPSPSELMSSTPVQPTPYQFFLCEYLVNRWQDSAPISSLMTSLANNAETTNIVTMYSIPYMSISGLSNQNLTIKYPEGDPVTISGWKFLGTQNNPELLLKNETPITYFGHDIDELLRVDHSVKLVVPEGGILDIPDELLKKPNLKIRQDVDLFSGASNYMLVHNDGTTDHFYPNSVRGSSISSIPILSDPYDTYISQNQNTLSASLLGDVASIAGGIGMAMATGGVGTAVGSGTAVSGLNNIVSKVSGIKDAGNRYSNPPAFLGTALAGSFNNRYWLIITKDPVDNATNVHNNFGYQYGKVGPLTLPSSGFIKTEGCSVMAKNGNVPRWALAEVNQIFNNGILVH